MNNDKNIVIKSQGQPDGGEGHSAGQAIRGNAAGEEGLCANMRGDVQEPSKAIWNRDESATQDEVLYSSYEEGRRLGARAWKVGIGGRSVLGVGRYWGSVGIGGQSKNS